MAMKWMPCIIRFNETTVTTKHLAEGIAADYDSQGRLAGIEILDAMKRLDGHVPPSDLGGCGHRARVTEGRS